MQKKCSELQERLQKQDVLNLLNNNSKNQEGITWDAVFLTSYRGLLKVSVAILLKPKSWYQVNLVKKLKRLL